MGYTIQYCPESNDRYPIISKRRPLRKVILIVLILLMMIFAVKYKSLCARLLLPGDPEVTAEAFQGLVADIKEGDAGNAITAFCREIFDHANE